jgi:hypothetical protein
MSVESNLPWRCENKKEDGDICQNMIKPADKFCCECGVKIVRRMALDSGHVASCTASGVNLQELSVRPAVISLEPAKSQSLPEPPGQSVTILSECDNCKKYDSQVSDSSSSSFMGPYHEGCKSGEEFRSWTMLDGDKEYCEYSGQEGCSFIASYVKETANSAVLESSCGDSSFQSTCLGEADRRSEDNGIQNVEESIVFAENKCDKTVSCDCLNQSLHKKLTIPDKSVLDQKDEGRIELINSMAGKQCDSVEQVDPPNLWIEKTVGNSNHFNLTKSLNVEPVSIRMVEDEDEIVAESHKGEHTLVAHNFSPDQQLNDSSELVGRESSRHIDTPVSLMVGHADAPITPVAMKDERADTCCSPESSLKVVANIADWEDVKRVASNAVQCEDNVVEESEGKRDEPVSSVLRATASTEEYGQSSDFDSGSESTCQTTDSTLHDSSKGVSTGHYACEDKLCSIQTLPPSRAYVGQNMASVTSHLQDHGGSSVLPSKGEHVVKSDDLNVSSSATSVVTPNKMEQSALCGGGTNTLLSFLTLMELKHFGVYLKIIYHELVLST